MTTFRSRAPIQTALVLFFVCVTACGPVRTTAVSSAPPTMSPITLFVTPDPTRLAPNDCMAPAPSGGSKAHSSALRVTVTLPLGWIENPADEGKNGLEATFALTWGPVGPNGANITADPFPSSMSPHDAVALEISQPGAGNVIRKGDCTIAASAAAYYESTIEVTTFPGITMVGDGYGVYVAHRGGLIRMLIDLPSSNGVSTPVPRGAVVSDIKSIFGSWTWDAP